jgi:hypothetical protein
MIYTIPHTTYDSPSMVGHQLQARLQRTNAMTFALLSSRSYDLGSIVGTINTAKMAVKPCTAALPH